MFRAFLSGMLLFSIGISSGYSVSNMNDNVVKTFQRQMVALVE